MTQFIKFEKQLKFTKCMDNDTKLCYLYMKDRLSLSKTNKQFFDKDKQQFYIIYTIQEMRNDLNVGKDKVIQCYQQLVKFGLLEKKRVFNGATKLFLPQNNESLIFRLPKFDFSESNKTYCINNDFVTKVTNDAAYPLEKNELSEKENESEIQVQKTKLQTAKPKPQIHESKNDKDIFTELEITRMHNSLITEYGVPERVVNTFNKYSSNLNDFREFRRLLFQSKKTVIKEIERDIRDGYNYDLTDLNFESNQALRTDLSNKVLSIILGAFNKAKNNKDRAYGLIFGAFKKVFREHIGIRCDSNDIIDIPLIDLTE